MSEEEKQEKVPKEEVPKAEEKGTDVNSNEGLLEKAERVRDENKKLLEDLRVENEKAEKLRARELLGGKSDNAPNEEAKKEETPQEYKDRVMRNEVELRE